jgi:hypothetical protein
MFDKKNVMVTELFVSEVEFISNSSQTLRICGLKGGNSRWRKNAKRLPRKKQRERGINAPRFITTPNAFGVTTPNFNPGGEFNFPPGFLL